MGDLSQRPRWKSNNTPVGASPGSPGVAGRLLAHPARQLADRLSEPLVPGPPVGLREDAMDLQTGRLHRRPQERRHILVVAEPPRHVPVAYRPRQALVNP